MKSRLSFLAITLLILFVAMGWAARSGGAAEPIKIGFMAPYIGSNASFGRDLRDGFKMCLDEYGYKVAGRQIVFIDEEEGSPEVGLTKARKMIEKDQVQILSGIILSSVAYAIKDYVVEKKIPLVIANAGARQLTQEQKSPYVFRASFANGQQDRVGGWYAYAKMGARKVVMMGADYAAGHEKGDGFAKVFKYMGGEVVDEMWPPMGTSDFAPYLAKLAPYVGKVDRVWAFFTSADAVQFINQYAEYGLKDKLKLICEEGVTDEVNLPSQGENVVGVESYARYCFSYDSPENRRFTTEYRKKYNQDAGSLSEGGYVSAKFILKALEAVKGKIEDKDAFLKALRVVKFEAPRGPVRFDEDQNVVDNAFIERVE
ncbi:MAG TPA: ABC transporter substrate-binding protein, partial [Syntrophorhabdales bacterium]|nr:ABC transporter substrate-binding protein [Syntrophorhabdales bacterium]